VSAYEAFFGEPEPDETPALYCCACGSDDVEHVETMADGDQLWVCRSCGMHNSVEGLPDTTNSQHTKE